MTKTKLTLYVDKEISELREEIVAEKLKKYEVIS